MEQTDTKLREIMWEVSGEDEDRRNIIFGKEKPDVIEDLEFDSIDIVEFISGIEEEFGVSFGKAEGIQIIWDYGRLLEWVYTSKRND